jgi:hypothetical protein
MPVALAISLLSVRLSMPITTFSLTFIDVDTSSSQAKTCQKRGCWINADEAGTALADAVTNGWPHRTGSRAVSHRAKLQEKPGDRRIAGSSALQYSLVSHGLSRHAMRHLRDDRFSQMQRVCLSHACWPRPRTNVTQD